MVFFPLNSAKKPFVLLKVLSSDLPSIFVFSLRNNRRRHLLANHSCSVFFGFSFSSKRLDMKIDLKGEFNFIFFPFIVQWISPWGGFNRLAAFPQCLKLI